MSARTPARPRLDADELAALEEERTFVRRSLADLDREYEAGDLDEADFAALGDDYRRRLEVLDSSIADGRAAFAERPRPSWGRRLLGVGAVVVLAVGAGVAVAAASGTRQAGQSITGDVRQSSAQLLSEAATLASNGEYTEALERYDEVLADDPDNANALADRGLLMVTIAQGAGVSETGELAAEGRESLDLALTLNPGNPRYLFYLGLVRRLDGDDAGARAAFEEALANDPAPDLKSQIEEYLAAIG